MSDYVWLLCGPGPNRFDDEHDLWEQPAQVFSTREKAMACVADVGDWFGVTVEWRSPNSSQHGFLMADLGDDNVWMLCRVPVDDDRGRLACLSGEHRWHRVRARATWCRAKTKNQRSGLRLV